jgi:predicted aldo/keto reductase-like oxidoreductase
LTGTVCKFYVNCPRNRSSININIMRKTNRRIFVRNMTGLALGTSLLPWACKVRGSSLYPTRVLGRTGEKVSILTLGGYHVAQESVTEEQSIGIIRKAIDMGVNFLDNAHVYNDGRSETMMGLALRDGYREKVLLMTKLRARTLEEIKRQLETSLKRFGLDSFDLMQFHNVGQQEGDVDAIYMNGLPEWAEEQRSQGVFKYIGFTGHADPKVLIDMIDRGFTWDTVQMPLNPGDHHRDVSFEKDVLPLAKEKGIGIIGMKSNGFGWMGNSGIATPVEGLRYAMSLPVATVVSGIDTMDILEENVGIFQQFTPMSEDEKAELLARCKGQSDVIEKHYRR